MPGVRTEVVPVGVMGSIPLRLNISLRTTEVGIPIKLIETWTLLRSAKYATENDSDLFHFDNGAVARQRL